MGKRSIDGINDTTNSASDGGVALGGDNSKSAGICNDATQKIPQSPNSEMIGREDRDNNQSGGVSDNMQDDSSSFNSSSDDGDDISEIVDLQKALEYLVSERDIEKIYNDIISTSHSSNTTAKSDKEKNTNDDEQLNMMIPNLVNRILMECYSQQPPTTNQQNNDTSCAQK